MIGVLHGYIEDSTNEWMEYYKEYTPIMHLSGYKLRFLGVNPDDIDDLVSRVSELFKVQEVHLYQGSEGNFQTLKIGKNYYELVIQVDYLRSDVVNEEDVEKCHKEIESILMTQFNVYDELIYLHPVHRIIGWEKK